MRGSKVQFLVRANDQFLFYDFGITTTCRVLSGKVVMSEVIDFWWKDPKRQEVEVVIRSEDQCRGGVGKRRTRMFRTQKSGHFLADLFFPYTFLLR